MGTSRNYGLSNALSHFALSVLFQVLSDNKLGTEGGRALSEMLINNKNIYKIDLTGKSVSCTYIHVCTYVPRREKTYLRDA